MSIESLYRIILADAHALYRHYLKQMIIECGAFEVIGEAGDGSELLDLLRHHTPFPHMVIVDIVIPPLGGIEATVAIKSAYPGIKVLILSMHREGPYAQKALLAGADGYILKANVDVELFRAMEKVRMGGVYLSTQLSEAEKI